jgi:hypothetical protein
MVSVEFKKSPVHGKGVFSKQAIPTGTRIWQVDETMHFCDARDMAALSKAKLRFALHGGYLHKPCDHFLWYTDGMQFMNHRETPDANVGLGTWPPLSQDHCVALRDIAAGEELFEDYSFWSDGGLGADHWLRPLYLAHCLEHYVFLRGLERFRVAA